MVEGEKSVLETLASDWKIASLQATEQFLSAYPQYREHSRLSVTTADMLRKAGSLQSNDRALAVVEMPESTEISFPKEGYILVLDNLRDPGNLGTILRIADWYGIEGIVCTPSTADVFNPKVINSSMGSFLRIPVQYAHLAEYLEKAKEDGLPVLGALMQGESTHALQFPPKGILVMGNESKGIDPGLHPFLTRRISIPRFGQAESLNVGIATAVICDRLKGQ